MSLKIKTFGFQNYYTRYEINFGDKIVHLKKIYKFRSDYFLIGHVVFTLNPKMLSKMKNYILHQIP